MKGFKSIPLLARMLFTSSHSDTPSQNDLQAVAVADAQTSRPTHATVVPSITAPAYSYINVRPCTPWRYLSLKAFHPCQQHDTTTLYPTTRCLTLQSLPRDLLAIALALRSRETTPSSCALIVMDGTPRRRKMTNIKPALWWQLKSLPRMDREDDELLR